MKLLLQPLERQRITTVLEGAIHDVTLKCSESSLRTP